MVSSLSMTLPLVIPHEANPASMKESQCNPYPQFPTRRRDLYIPIYSSTQYLSLCQLDQQSLPTSYETGHRQKNSNSKIVNPTANGPPPSYNVRLNQDFCDFYSPLTLDLHWGFLFTLPVSNIYYCVETYSSSVMSNTVCLILSLSFRYRLL